MRVTNPKNDTIPISITYNLDAVTTLAMSVFQLECFPIDDDNGASID